MPSGGRRPGAGRKKGSLTRKTREIANQAAEEGVSPLEVMLKAMRVYYDAGDYANAATFAAAAAPYCHPRLSAVQVRGDGLGPVIQVICDERDSAPTILALPERDVQTARDGP